MCVIEDTILNCDAFLCVRGGGGRGGGERVSKMGLGYDDLC